MAHESVLFTSLGPMRSVSYGVGIHECTYSMQTYVREWGVRASKLHARRARRDSNTVPNCHWTTAARMQDAACMPRNFQPRRLINDRWGITNAAISPYVQRIDMPQRPSAAAGLSIQRVITLVPYTTIRSPRGNSSGSADIRFTLNGSSEQNKYSTGRSVRNVP